MNLGRWRSGTICTGSNFFQRYWRSSVVQPSWKIKLNRNVKCQDLSLRTLQFGATHCPKMKMNEKSKPVPIPLGSSTCALTSFFSLLSHMIYLKVTGVFSFPKLSDGKQKFFFCLSTTEAWTFYKMNALNPLRFTSHQKNCKFLNYIIKLPSAK